MSSTDSLFKLLALSGPSRRVPEVADVGPAVPAAVLFSKAVPWLQNLKLLSDTALRDIVRNFSVWSLTAPRLPGRRVV